MTDNSHDRRGFLKALLMGAVTIAALPLLAPPAKADDEGDDATAADALEDFEADAQAGRRRRRIRRIRRRRAARRAKRKGK